MNAPKGYERFLWTGWGAYFDSHTAIKGGAGSGNWNHRGVVGQHGGSAPTVAVHTGRAHNQKAIANLRAIAAGDWDHAFIDTGGTGEATKASDGGGRKCTMFLFDGDVSPETIWSAIKEHVGE